MRAWTLVVWVLCVGSLACSNDDKPSDQGSEFPSVTDFAAAGPYGDGRAALITNDTCEITLPQTLADSTLHHPVILWGNGTSAQTSFYRGVLSHWSSHGFIVAAALTSNSGSGSEMLACLDFVLAENDREGSALFDKVDPTRIGASGHSQGGAGTLMAARDPRVIVTAPLQPFVQFPLGGFDDAAITDQHAPMFLMSGSADTIAAPGPNQQPIFDTTNVPVFWGTLLGADHLQSALGDITGYRGPATAWFRLHLMDDESARGLFYGDDCGLCTNAEWTVQRKGIE